MSSNKLTPEQEAQAKKLTEKDIFGHDDFMALDMDMGYSEILLLPYDDGIALLALLKKAEKLKGQVFEIRDGTIKILEHAAVKVDIVKVSRKDYREAKIYHLLKGNDEE